MSDQRPGAGPYGARDFRGQVLPEYSPRDDGDPDPGEVVWAWVPFEEDPSRGKDRPVVVIGRDVADHDRLVALMLSSKDHDGDARWHPVGTGAWDGERRDSWVRVDRLLAVATGSVRREGSALGPQAFLSVVEHALGSRSPGPGSGSAPSPGRRAAPGGRGREVSGLVGIHAPHGGLARALGRIVGRRGCALCDLTRSPLRGKPEWDRAVVALGVPVRLAHLDGLSTAEQRAVPAPEDAPAVLARVGDRFEVVLGPADLEQLGGSVSAFARSLRSGLRRRHLVLAQPDGSTSRSLPRR